MQKLIVFWISTVFLLSGCSDAEKLSDYLIPKQRSMTTIEVHNGFIVVAYDVTKDAGFFQQYYVISGDVSEKKASLSAQDEGLVVAGNLGVASVPENFYLSNKVVSGTELYSDSLSSIAIVNVDRKLTINGKETKCIDVSNSLPYYGDHNARELKVYCKGFGMVGIVPLLRSDSDLYATSYVLNIKPAGDFEESIAAAIGLGTAAHIEKIMDKSGQKYSSEQKMNARNIILGVQELIINEAHNLFRGGFHTLEAQKLEKYGIAAPLSKISAASLASCIVTMNGGENYQLITSYLQIKAQNRPLDTSRGEALSIVIGKCLDSIPGIPKKLAVTETPVGSAQSMQSASKGELLAFLSGKDYNYQFTKLDSEEAAKIFALMARQPVEGWRPLGNEDDNPIYRDAEIVNEANGSSRYAKTSLLIGKKIILTTSPVDENETQAYEMTGLSAMETQPEILMLHTYAGGNGCESQQQVLVLRGEKGFHSTEPFGRCSLAWWEDKDSNTAYFVYSADEYSPMEVLALNRINK